MQKDIQIFQEFAKRLNYNPETGEFTNKKSGKKVGYDNRGHIRLSINVDGVIHKELAHRLAWFIVHNEIPNIVHHLNHQKNDNRITNLENTTHRKNITAWTTLQKFTSKYTGVSWFKKNKCWEAYININNKRERLGFFKDELEAANAYQQKLKELREE